MSPLVTKKVGGASSSLLREQDAPATMKKVGGASSSLLREQDAPATMKKVGGASSSLLREQDAPTTLWEYFNPLTEIDVRTGGSLPHWEQGSVWYFVTFRLADALPATVIEEMKEQREQWKKKHDLSNLSREEQAEYHRLFSERHENLLNAGSGSCVLRDPQIAEVVKGAFRYFQGQRYDLDEYVVMANHIHVLVKPLAGHGLTDILHSWKSFTANQINRRLNRQGQLWLHESYDHIVRNEPAMCAIRRYIRDNPLKVAGASSSRQQMGEQDAPATLREQDAPTTLREQDAPITFGLPMLPLGSSCEIKRG